MKQLFATLWSIFFFLATTIHTPVLALEFQRRLAGPITEKASTHVDFMRSSPVGIVKTVSHVQIQHPAFHAAIHDKVIRGSREFFALAYFTKLKNGTVYTHATLAEAQALHAKIHPDFSVFAFFTGLTVAKAIGYSIALFIAASGISSVIYAIRGGGGAARTYAKGQLYKDGPSFEVGTGGMRKRQSNPSEMHLIGVPDNMCALQSYDASDDNIGEADDLSEDIADQMAQAVYNDLTNNNLANVGYRIENMDDNYDGVGELQWTCASSDGETQSEDAPDPELDRRGLGDTQWVDESVPGIRVLRGNTAVAVAGSAEGQNRKRYRLGSPTCASITSGQPLAEDCQDLQTYFNSQTGTVNVDDGMCEYFSVVDSNGQPGACYFQVCNSSGCGAVVGDSNVLSGIFGGIISTCVDTMDSEGYEDQTNPTVEYQVTTQQNAGAVHASGGACS